MRLHAPLPFPFTLWVTVKLTFESCVWHRGFRNARSSANPWLDFLPASTAHKLAGELNEDLESYCSTSPSLTSNSTFKRLYGFGLLPLVPEVSTTSLLEIVDQISKLPHLRGIIMGTKGIGNGLDDEALEPVWEAIAKAGLVVFLHPHYGVDSSAWGGKDNGHVLPLALGFPFETTTVSPISYYNLFISPLDPFTLIEAFTCLFY